MDIVKFLQILKEIPDTIYGAVIGAGFAVLCTWMQSMHSFKMANQQRKYDSDNSKKQHDKNIKKEILLSAIEGVGFAQNFLFDFIYNYNSDQMGGNTFRAPFALWARIYAVCDVDTMRAIDKIQKFYINNFMILLEYKIPIANLESDINILNMKYDYLKSKQDEILLKMKEINEGKTLNNITFEYLSEKFQEISNEIETISNQIYGIQINIFAKQRGLLKFITENMKEFSIYIVEFYKAIRKELEMVIFNEYWDEFKPEMIDPYKTKIDEILEKAIKETS